jgi:hypothetical protein
VIAEFVQVDDHFGPANRWLDGLDSFLVHADLIRFLFMPRIVFGCPLKSRVLADPPIYPAKIVCFSLKIRHLNLKKSWYPQITLYIMCVPGTDAREAGQGTHSPKAERFAPNLIARLTAQQVVGVPPKED